MIASFYLAGFIQSLFFVLLISTKKAYKKSDLILSLFLALIGMKLLSIYLSENELVNKDSYFLVLEIVYWTLLGPSLFVYIDLIVAEKQIFKTSYLLNFLPLLIVFMGYLEFLTADKELNFNNIKSDSILFKVGQYVWLFNTHLYYIFCLILLHKHSKKIKHSFSNTKNIDLKWLRILTIGFSFFLFYLLAFLLIRRFLQNDIPFINPYASWLIMVIYVFGLGFCGYKQGGIFSDIKIINSNVEQGNTFVSKKSKKPLYEKSGLTMQEKENILLKLTNYMEVEKPYLNPNLNINELANKLNVPVHKLSQTINQNIQKSFFEFINEYRIKQAINCLQDQKYDKFSIIAIAYDSGFNSKSSFYKIFKKHTSMTPAQFKKHNCN